MKKVLFVYIDYDLLNPTLIGGSVNHGLAYLAGALKENNIHCKLFHIMTPFTESAFLETFKKYEDYNIIALSFNSYRCKENYQVAAFIKKKYPGKYIVAGGVHPTVSSEEVITNNNIDCICIGEGEFVLTEIVRKYHGLHFHLINNIYYKKNGEIQRNAINHNNTDFDEYPMPDYSIYDFS